MSVLSNTKRLYDSIEIKTKKYRIIGINESDIIKYNEIKEFICFDDAKHYIINYLNCSLKYIINEV